MTVFAGTMQLTLSMVIMQVTMSYIFAGFEVVLSVTGMLVDLYCNYADGSLCYNYAGGISCTVLYTRLFQATISYSVL